MRLLTIFLFGFISLQAFMIDSKTVIYSREKDVAKELKSYLEKIFQRDFKVDRYKTSNSIMIVKNNSLDMDSFKITSTKDTLKIEAKNKRGLFYGVYFFLEEYLGCKFLTKDVEVIPKRDSFSLGSFSLTKKPRFAYREFFSGSSEDIEFATKLGLNGRLGHRVWKDKAHFPKLRKVYNEFSSSELLGDEFECDGQYDYADKDAQKKALKTAKEKIKKIEVFDDDYIYFQHEDRNSFCKNREDFLRYTIFLANHIEKNILYEAYQWSRAYPKDIKTLPKNLSIFFSTIDANFAKSLDTKENRDILTTLKKWDRFDRDIIIWDYITNFGGYLQPTPNIYSQAKNIKIYSKIKNVNGVFLQGSYDCGAGELDELRTWVFAKLMWSPNKGVDSLIKSFCDAYYKEASKDVIKYIKAVEKLSNRLDDKLYIKTSVQKRYLEKKYLNYLEKILDYAYHDSNSKDVKKRVLKLYSSLDYVRVVKGSATQKQKRRFKEFLKEYKVENFIEGTSVENLLDMMRYQRKEPTPPKIVKGLKKGVDWFEYQEFVLKLCCTKYAKDTKSSDLVVATMDGEQKAWGFQLDVANLPKGEWDVYASVRVDKDSSIIKNALPAIYCGADPTQKGVYFSAQFKDGVYKDIKIATIDTKNIKDDYVWLSPTGNSAIKKVYVDRFFIVRRR